MSQNIMKMIEAVRASFPLSTGCHDDRPNTSLFYFQTFIEPNYSASTKPCLE